MAHLPTFEEICKQVQTDKCLPTRVDDHQYHRVYPRFLEPIRNTRLKMLEIGLGCDMTYGPGHSVALWKAYLPRVELWEAEVDQACAAAYNSSLDHRVLAGNQRDPDVLREWVRLSSGGFHVIVDDGSHVSHDQFAAFSVLWDALEPRGFYFFEDVHYVSNRSEATTRSRSAMLEVVGEWGMRLAGAKSRFSYRHSHRATAAMSERIGGLDVPEGLPRGLFSVACFHDICVLEKGPPGFEQPAYKVINRTKSRKAVVLASPADERNVPSPPPLPRPTALGRSRTRRKAI